jgi:hypothetical protein
VAQKLGLTISGFLLKYEEMARKTKKQIAKIQQRYRIAALTLDIFVLTLVFFNFALTLNNNWDDLNLLTICFFVLRAISSYFNKNPLMVKPNFCATFCVVAHIRKKC